MQNPMTIISKTYIEQAISTECGYEQAQQRMKSVAFLRLMHGAMGVVTEGGEIMDHMKKCLFYGKIVDEVNMKEEIGDTLWYLAILCHVLEVTDFDDIMETNIEKLRIRYPEKFKEYDALNRNLDAERAHLESKHV